MASFNKVVLMGNLTHDPDIRTVGSNGMKVARLRMAINERRRDRNGQPIDCPVFIDVDAWDKLADLCSRHLSKGRTVLVDGRLQMDTWERDGVRHQRLKVRAITLKFLPQPERRDRYQDDRGQDRQQPPPESQFDDEAEPEENAF